MVALSRHPLAAAGRRGLVLTAFCALTWCVAAQPSGAASAEPGTNPSPVTPRHHDFSGVDAALHVWYQAYRGSLSRVRGPVCVFEPSCSRFSEQAFREHGILLGALLTGDRLQRCHWCVSPQHYPRGMVSGPFGNAVRDPVADHVGGGRGQTPRTLSWIGELLCDR
ncbi:MAG: membrane protein insertion efficiency factor YidD [Armatimonadota bacterium]|nr:membrane protein insertion efficiency factor YidD [Armatimonadota bacterium]